MKKEVIKHDIIIFEKLKNENFRSIIFYANEVCRVLKINDEMTYIKYQIYFDKLKEVTYDDITSYNRLLNISYYNTIEKLVLELRSKSKIITFPKLN